MIFLNFILNKLIGKRMKNIDKKQQLLDAAQQLHCLFKDKKWYRCVCIDKGVLVLMCFYFPTGEKIPLHIKSIPIGISGLGLKFNPPR